MTAGHAVGLACGGPGASRSLGGLIERLAAVGVITSGVVLAAQTFLALIPLLLGIVAFAPPGLAETLTDQLRARFGISGSTDRMLVGLTGQRDQLRSGITVLGALVVLVSATAFTRALQRVYETAWGLPRFGLRGSVRGLVWLAGLVAYLSLLGLRPASGRRGVLRHGAAGRAAHRRERCCCGGGRRTCCSWAGSGPGPCWRPAR